MLYIITATLSCSAEKDRKRIYIAKTRIGYLIKVIYCALFYDWVDVEMLYLCDHKKNTKCAKTYCHINGGECRHTTSKECKL